MGNFWWARCDYVNTLRRLESLNTHAPMYRFEAEGWINGQGLNGKDHGDGWRPKNCYTPHNMQVDGVWFYDHEIPESAYNHANGCRSP